MNYQDKTKEELIGQILELQKENRDIKISHEKNISVNLASLNNDEPEHLDSGYIYAYV